jgi:hypothetical protein
MPRTDRHWNVQKFQEGTNMKGIYANLLLSAALGLGATLMITAPTRAGEPLQVAGKAHCKSIEQHAISVEGDPDHVVVVMKGTCDLSASGQSQMMDGGHLDWAETGDYIMGSGTSNGYYLAKYKDGSTEICSYTQIVTATTVDGKPHVTFRGADRHVSGTGRLANVKYVGTHWGDGISPTEAAEEFQGTLIEASK